ncbi:NRDE family protein [Alkalicoccus halolimnae]|uniref:NRDE family protein n=1 Tax=Alkalicoccus halolimnae TaxID=1667239 RepID=A0A5C7FCF8_9BACI|nr:NRDE family protein [Alkalicoccus halolimnae]TXF87160.1 NRDE family protein [Alkalicoccus halolimnae]
MCIIGVGMKINKDFPFIFAANRDEFVERPAAPAHWWNEETFFAGKDLQAGGTWMGISRSGRVAAVTNVRNPDESGDFPYSRGELVPAWLNERNLNLYLQEKAYYAGFNLIYGTTSELKYVTNQHDREYTLREGIFSLSNADMDEEWPKTKHLRQDIKRAALLPKEEMIAALISGLERKIPYPDNELPDTGVGIELERKLSSPFIDLDKYGTRCTTVVLVDKNNEVTFVEKTHRPEKYEVRKEFRLKK